MSDANGGGSLTALPIIETQVSNESHNSVKNLFFIYRMSLLSHPSGRRCVRLHPDQRDLHHGRPDLLGDGALLQGHPPRHQRRPLRLQGRLRRAAEGHEAGKQIRDFICNLIVTVSRGEKAQFNMTFTIPHPSVRSPVR